MMAIPADIQKAAERVYAQLGRGSIADEQTIAKALMAEREACALNNITTTERHISAAVFLERERCAVIAEEYGGFTEETGSPPTDFSNEGRNEAAREIAAAIRSPQPSPTTGAAP